MTDLYKAIYDHPNVQAFLDDSNHAVRGEAWALQLIKTICETQDIIINGEQPKMRIKERVYASERTDGRWVR